MKKIKHSLPVYHPTPTELQEIENLSRESSHDFDILREYTRNEQEIKSQGVTYV